MHTPSFLYVIQDLGKEKKNIQGTRLERIMYFIFPLLSDVQFMFFFPKPQQGVLILEVFYLRAFGEYSPKWPCFWGPQELCKFLCLSQVHLSIFVLDGSVLSSTVARINLLNNLCLLVNNQAIMLRRRFLQSVAEKAAREKRKREEAMKVGASEKS